jgi:hypothetical protein
MPLFRRAGPKDINQLFAALTHGTFEEFLDAYDPRIVNWDGYAMGSLLTLALRSKEFGERPKIVARLLDDGADVTVGKPLHVLLGGNTHDFASEVRLLDRLLDAGADVNKSTARDGTPLEVIAARFKYDDRTLTPVYDVLLRRPELDLLRPGLSGRPVLLNLRKWYARRADLVERCESLLLERGIPVPPPGNDD